MHEMNREKLDRGYGWSWICELVRQLDERYVKREEQHYHIEIDDPHGFLNDEPEPPVIFEEPEPQTWISDTADSCHSSTGTCKCPICYTWVYPKLVSRWSCNPDEDPHSPVQPKACPHDLFNSCEECYTDGQRKPEQPKKCECIGDHWITDICEYNTYPKFCCYCGLPLPKEEEKP